MSEKSEAAKPQVKAAPEAPKTAAAKKAGTQTQDKAITAPKVDPAAQTTAKKPAQPKPSTENQVKDAISQGLKLFGQ